MTVMRRTICSGKLSAALSLAVALSILFTSVVYACSGLNLMQMNGHHVAMNHETVERGPCAEHKQDLCKSVRERMLSVQPSFHKLDESQQPISLAPLSVLIDIPKHLVLLPNALIWQTAFHSVFKLPLPLFLSVLRI
jgi:hypothetical protein